MYYSEFFENLKTAVLYDASSKAILLLQQFAGMSLLDADMFLKGFLKERDKYNLLDKDCQEKINKLNAQIDELEQQVIDLEEQQTENGKRFQAEFKEWFLVELNHRLKLEKR